MSIAQSTPIEQVDCAIGRLVLTGAPASSADNSKKRQRPLARLVSAEDPTPIWGQIPSVSQPPLITARSGRGAARQPAAAAALPATAAWPGVPGGLGPGTGTAAGPRRWP